MRSHEQVGGCSGLGRRGSWSVLRCNCDRLRCWWLFRLICSDGKRSGRHPKPTGGCLQTASTNDRRRLSLNRRCERRHGRKPARRVGIRVRTRCTRLRNDEPFRWRVSGRHRGRCPGTCWRHTRWPRRFCRLLSATLAATPRLLHPHRLGCRQCRYAAHRVSNEFDKLLCRRPRRRRPLDTAFTHSARCGMLIPFQRST